MSAILKEPGLTMRPMQDRDLTDVMEIERRSYPHPWTRLIFRDCLHAGYSCWVAERQQVIEGYGVISVAAGESHLLNLCVRPAAWRQGLGRTLLGRLLDVARGNNVTQTSIPGRPFDSEVVLDGAGLLVSSEAGVVTMLSTRDLETIRTFRRVGIPTDLIPLTRTHCAVGNAQLGPAFHVLGTTAW